MTTQTERTAMASTLSPLSVKTVGLERLIVTAPTLTRPRCLDSRSRDGRPEGCHAWRCSVGHLGPGSLNGDRAEHATRTTHPPHRAPVCRPSASAFIFCPSPSLPAALSQTACMIDCQRPKPPTQVQRHRSAHMHLYWRTCRSERNDRTEQPDVSHPPGQPSRSTTKVIHLWHLGAAPRGP